MTTHGIYAKDKDGNNVYYCGYICAERNKGNCNTGSISHNKVDAAFREYIEGIKDFEVETEINLQIEQEEQKNTATLKTECEASLSKLLKKERDIMTLYINDKVDYDEYYQMLVIIRSEKKAYADKINELEDTEAINVQFQKDDIIKNFRENWDTLTKLERMQFLQTYIKAVYVASEPDSENPRKKHVVVKKLEFYKTSVA